MFVNYYFETEDGEYHYTFYVSKYSLHAEFSNESSWMIPGTVSVDDL